MQNSFMLSYSTRSKSETANRKFTQVHVLGVTSLVPNLNGFLLYVENGNHYQIDSDELLGKGISCCEIRYPSALVNFDNEIEYYKSRGDIVIEGRK